MNRAAFVGTTLAAFACGVFAGIVLSRRSTPSSRGDADRVGVALPASLPPSEEGASRKPGDAEEIERLRGQLGELEARLAAPARTDDSERVAEEIYNGLKNPKAKDDPKAYLRLLGLLSDLRPSMTPYFVRKYRESRPRLDGVSLDLAFASGGPEAIALIKEIYEDPAVPKAERVWAGIALAGGGLLAQSTATLPADPAILELAGRVLGLSEPAERQGGAGLLGLQDTQESRGLLQSLVTNDRHELVRVAAVRSLARVGDRSTREFLFTWAASAYPQLLTEEDIDEEKLPAVARAILAAMTALDKKFPGD